MNPLKLRATRRIYLFLFCFSNYVFLGGGSEDILLFTNVRTGFGAHIVSYTTRIGAPFPDSKGKHKSYQFLSRLGISGANPPPPFVHGVVLN